MDEKSQPGYYASHPKKSSEFLLLQQIKSSNVEIAAKAKNKLLKDNEPFLISFIGNWLPPESRYLFPELLQGARLAFLKALDRYNPIRDISIRAFAKFFLLKLKDSFFKKISWIELTEFHLQEECLQPEIGLHYTDLRAILKEAISHLSSMEQLSIQLHFFCGMKGREIAIQRGISEPRVSALLKSGLQKMKEYLVSKGIKPGAFNFN